VAAGEGLEGGVLLARRTGGLALDVVPEEPAAVLAGGSASLHAVCVLVLPLAHLHGDHLGPEVAVSAPAELHIAADRALHPLDVLVGDREDDNARQHRHGGEGHGDEGHSAEVAQVVLGESPGGLQQR